MFAFEIPKLRFSLPAGAAVAIHRFVTADASSNAVAATATDQIIGVSMNEVATDKGVTAAQQIVEIATGLVIVEAGAAITAGAVVYAGAAGVAAASGTINAGIAITSAAAAGDLITVKVN
jgi:hypothetical protein